MFKYPINDQKTGVGIEIILRQEAVFQDRTIRLSNLVPILIYGVINPIFGIENMRLGMVIRSCKVL